MNFLNRLLSVFRFGSAPGAPSSSVLIQLYGSPIEMVSLAGSPVLETLSGSPVEAVTLGGSL